MDDQIGGAPRQEVSTAAQPARRPAQKKKPSGAFRPLSTADVTGVWNATRDVSDEETLALMEDCGEAGQLFLRAHDGTACVLLGMRAYEQMASKYLR